MESAEKLAYTASGCMTFIRSMANQHYVPVQDLYELVSELCAKESGRLASMDKTRNT